ncbi:MULTISPECIES: hypothetical protein [Lachnospiraceae]|jgi:hypothetical protein|uniref:hypothetical protein n=1 Tax=Lachnospiraceae TaxID=186803 RepID=UPI00206449DA|nr:hypothetical protein [Coprococcus catus]DAR51011.1 MAG TPA: hypothetical protein [Caudoviricetes sp.]
MEALRNQIDLSFLNSSDKKWITDTADDVLKKNPDTDKARICQMLYSYLALRHITKGRNVKVKYELFEPSKNMGYISVTGRKIDYQNSKVFKTVTALATNFEAYPKTNGTVQLNFTFHKLRKKRGDGCNGKCD